MVLTSSPRRGTPTTATSTACAAAYKSGGSYARHSPLLASTVTAPRAGSRSHVFLPPRTPGTPGTSPPPGSMETSTSTLMTRMRMRPGLRRSGDESRTASGTQQHVDSLPQQQGRKRGRGERDDYLMDGSQGGDMDHGRTGDPPASSVSGDVAWQNDRHTPADVSDACADDDELGTPAILVDKESAQPWSLDTNANHMWNAPRTPGTPVPLANTTYAIKGGLDTPEVAMAHQDDNSAAYFDEDYRRRLGETAMGDLVMNDDAQALGHTVSQLAYASSASQVVTHDTEAGWSIGRPILQAVGGVVGKVWDFCTLGAFRGFHAGGGKGYDFHADGSATMAEHDASWLNRDEGSELAPQHAASVPGRFPDEDYIHDYMDHLDIHSPGSPASRSTKRRQVEEPNNDGLARNWVMVPREETSRHASSNTSSFATPRRNHPPDRLGHTSSRASQASSRHVRPYCQSRAPYSQSRTTSSSHVGLSSTSAAASKTTQASFASPRSPLSSRIPIASRSPSPTKTRRGAPLASTPLHLRRASTTHGTPSARSVGPATSTSHSTSTSTALTTPDARDAQRWAEKRRRDERAHDESLRRLDRQLKAMIREGKEALGTRVRVEYEGEGGSDFEEEEEPVSGMPGSRAELVKRAAVKWDGGGGGVGDGDRGLRRSMI